jgi:hypothetical protein
VSNPLLQELFSYNGDEDAARGKQKLQEQMLPETLGVQIGWV